MIYHRVFVPVLAVLVLALPGPAQAGKKDAKSGGAARPAVPGPAAAKFPIAVVRIDEVAQQTKAFKSGQRRLKSMGEDFNDRLATLKGKIDDLKLDLNNYKDSPTRTAKQIELEGLVGRSRAAAQLFQQQIELARRRMDGKIRVEVDTAVAGLARKRGILLVLRKLDRIDAADLLAKKAVRSDLDALRNEHARDRRRIVLFSSAAIDITADVIKYLKAN